MTSTHQLEEQLKGLSLSQDAPVTRRNIEACLEALSDYTVSRRSVSLAYAYLARNILAQSPTSVNTRRAETLELIIERLDAWLVETSFPELAKAFGALTVVLETDKSAFDEIMQTNAIQEKVIDAGDTVTMVYKIVDPDEYKRVKISFAIFISQAAASATQLARQLANPADSRNWLYNRFKDEEESQLCRIAACVAFVKFKGISRPGSAQQSAPASGGADSMAGDDNMNYPLLKELIDFAKATSVSFEPGADATREQSVQLALEALGVATLKPSARRLLASDPVYGQKLLDLARIPQLQFSTAVIISNLVAHSKLDDSEDGIKAGLRKYAAGAIEADEETETPGEMVSRCKALLDIGTTTTAVLYTKSNSVAVRRLAAQILLGLAEDRRHRGVMLQQGAAKAALEIVLKSSLSQKSDLQPAKEDIVPVQVLAKFLITANPLHVFGPTPQSPLLIATLGPLSIPILQEGSSLLQRFESLMALTNITGLSEELQERVASQPSFLQKLEDIILDGNSEGDSMDGKSMCRRASVELLCNLASCETAFIRYTAIDQEADLKTGRLPGPVGSRINVLVALADADDLATRQAAAGALATFTLAPTVARYLSVENKRISKLLAMLDNPDSGMQLRAIECLKNVGLASSGQQKGTILAAFQKLQGSATGAEVKSSIKEATEALG